MKTVYWKTVIILLFLLSLSDAQQFYLNGKYQAAIPTPEKVLGQKVGERPLRYAEIIRYFEVLADASPRVKMFVSGETHEGRTLYYLLVSSTENINRLDAILADISTLADARKSSSRGSRETLIKNTPAIAWMMYSIHGDELSGADASVFLAYQLAAGEDETTLKLLNSLVIGIDPMENPDGRERYLAQMQQWSGPVPNSDAQSIQHSGMWPWGRTNHYLFDLNRDWFILSQPESRARVKAITKWHPQVVVDAHEMGSYDTYLFNPPRDPIHPQVTNSIQEWWSVFAADQAKAFDEYGWSYYTREWLEEWYPGYGSSWPLYLGAVGILYEQASTDGSPVKRPDGGELTFSASVHHQFISSMANLTTAADNREQLLRHYHTFRKNALKKRSKSEAAVYIIDPGKNPSRALKLVERLKMQGIEVLAATEKFRVSGLRSYFDKSEKKRTFSPGTYIVRLDQPLRPLIHAILEPDPRMTNDFLRSERESLEKRKRTRLYEVSAWSYPLAYGLKAYALRDAPEVRTTQLDNLTMPGKLENPGPAFGYLIPYQDDRATDALWQMLNRGMNIRSAKKPFKVNDRAYERGTLLLRRNENAETLEAELNALCLETGIMVYGVSTALSQEGPDLGGGEFQLLTTPHIAMLTGSPISMYNFGAMWYLLDHEMRQRFTIMNHNRFSNYDLRKYNVIVLPSAWGSYQKILTKSDLKKLKAWIQNGGTLISVGGASAFITDSTTALSKVRQRRQVLSKLGSYENAVAREASANSIRIDSLAVWEGKTSAKNKAVEKDKTITKGLKEIDERQRLFRPRGTILRLKLDPEHWLNFGLEGDQAALFSSSYAYLSKAPVQTAARFSKAEDLRMSGLLWPEARERWQQTAYLTRESLGSGQIILFAGEPNFRSYFYGTARLFVNAILLGPGFGTRTLVDW